MTDNRLIDIVILASDASTTVHIRRLLDKAEIDLLTAQIPPMGANKKSKDFLLQSFDKLAAFPLVISGPALHGRPGRKPNPHPLPPVPGRRRKK